MTDYCIDGEPGEQRAAVVMIGNLKDATSWPDEYEAECLDGLSVEKLSVKPPITAGFLATRGSGPGAGIRVAHYLLNLRKR